MDLYPLSFDDVVKMSWAWMEQKNVPLDSPQFLLGVFLWHQEHEHCAACKYHYSGHDQLVSLARGMWGWTQPDPFIRYAQYSRLPIKAVSNGSQSSTHRCTSSTCEVSTVLNGA